MKLEFFGTGKNSKAILQYTDEMGRVWDFEATCSHFCPTIDAIEEGLRALNDAPMQRKRIWINFYKTHICTHETKASALRNYDSACLRRAVPFIEEIEPKG